MQIFRQWPIYALGRILPAAIGFGGVAVYTRMLDPESFGIYALLLSISFLVGLIGFSWLRVASLRMVSSVAVEDEANLMATVGISFAAMAVIVAAAIVVAVRVSSPSLGWGAALLTAACALLSGWFELNVVLVLARVKVAAVGILQTARALGQLLGALALIAAGFKAAALLGGFAIGNCAGFGAVRVWKPAFRGHFDTRLFREFFRFGWPSSAAAISYFSNTFQRFLLQAVGGSAAVGIYAAASDFSQQTVGLLIGTATLAGQPLAFRARDLGSTDQLSEQLRNNARLIFAVALPATAALVVLSGPVSQIYLGARFHVHSGIIVAITAITMLLSGLRGSYFEQAFEIARKTRALAVNTALRVGLTIVASIWLIPHNGLVGAAGAVLFAEAIGLCVSIVWARRVIHLPIPSESWLKITAATSAMVAALVLIPGRYSVLGLALSVIIGSLVYCSVVALTHLRGIRAHLAAPVAELGGS